MLNSHTGFLIGRREGFRLRTGIELSGGFNVLDCSAIFNNITGSWVECRIWFDTLR